jgi:hypothetical protein
MNSTLTLNIAAGPPINASRRALLIGSTALLAIPLMNACSSSASAALTNALTIGQTIDAGLLKIVADANTLDPTLVTASEATTIEGDLNLAAQGIAALLGMTAPPAGASTMTVIDTYFQDAMDLVTPILGSGIIPGGSLIIGAIDAVEALLPVFEAVITPTPVAAIVRRDARLTNRIRPRVEMSTATAVQTIKQYVAR